MNVENRLGDDAHRVLRSARWWARHLGADRVGERHLLIGIVSVDDPELRFQLHGLRMTTHTVVESMGLPDDELTGMPADDVQVELSAEVEAVLLRALGESVKLDDDDIRPAHLLLALLEVDSEAVNGVLQRLGVDRLGLADEVRGLLGARPRDGRRRVAAMSPGGDLLDMDPPVRGWTTPRCGSCHKLLADHAQVSTMLFEEETSGEQLPFRLLWCTACGTTLHVDRLGSPRGNVD